MQVVIIYISFLFSGLLIPILPDHAVYVGVVEISEGKDPATGKVLVKVFADDLEDAIFNQSANRLNLQKGNCEKHLAYVERYIAEHLSLVINEEQIELSIASCERMDMSLWFDFQFKYSSEWKDMKVSGDFLMELFPTQSNVFSIKYKDEKRMFRLTSDKKSELINL